MKASPGVTLVSHLNKQQIDEQVYNRQTLATLASLENAVPLEDLTFYSNRPPDEVKALQEEVASIVPAGNIVALVTSGLANLRGRKLTKDQAQSDVSALMRGIEVLPKTLFGAFFVPTAAVLSGYQKLLMMTGKDPESAFPDGLWQFYLEFAMREDSAHHTNETIGFQTALTRYGLSLSQVDQLAAWVCALSQFYFQYDNIIHNDWRENIYLSLLQQIAAETGFNRQLQFQRLFKAWGSQRPYQRSPQQDYVTYRWHRFNEFLASRLEDLPAEVRDKLNTAYAERANQELAAYQEQMTILATLDPERYREVRTPIPLWQTKVGVIVNDRYYLLPACATDATGQPLMFATTAPDTQSYALSSDEQGRLYHPQGEVLQGNRTGQLYDQQGQMVGEVRPVDFQMVRQMVATIFDGTVSTEPAQLDQQLLAITRYEHERARKKISAKDDIRLLKTAPIIINWDKQPGSQPLAYIRRGRRAFGDHATTIFRTDHSMVFDQSHIFFDGIGGLAASEILTQEAVSWAALFHQVPAPAAAEGPLINLNLVAEPTLENFSKVKVCEVSAESSDIDLKTLERLRKKWPKLRDSNIKPTVNDLIVFYRSKFGLDYWFSPKIETELAELREAGKAGQQAYDLVQENLAALQQSNPSILIPLSAAAINPRDRLYPTTFRNPFADIWTIYDKASNILDRYTVAPNQTNWAEFTDMRGSLLAQLSYFGELLEAYKAVARQGESTSAATMKLLGHLPGPVRELLNQIPQHIDVLNEVLKGEEVISNVGRVANGASLTRFASAKDDNENKTLVWGLLTDDRGRLQVTLRDFRPHVTALAALDRLDLAEMIVKDQVEVFTTGFNQFARRLLEIIDAKAQRIR